MDGNIVISIGEYDSYLAVGLLLVAAFLIWMWMDIYVY